MVKHKVTKIEEAATMELRRSLTAVAALREMVVELEQENEELRREIETLKERIQRYETN